MRVLAAILLLTSLGFAKIPVIFDTDIGDDIDDALALALAMKSPELDVRLVTTVVDDTESRTRLAWKELKMYGGRDVAVATGASEPLLDPLRKGRAPQFQVLTAEDVVPPAARKRAAEAIVDMLLASKQKITLVPVGPLTNIALALKLEPAIKTKIERIVLMGGAFDPAKAEYNIRRDHAAARIVFESGVPIVAVGLDVTLKCKLQGADLDRLAAAKGVAPQFLVKLIRLWQNGKPQQYPTLHDPLAVAVTAIPDLIETSTGSVTVDDKGVTTFTAGAGNVKVARNVDVRRFLDLFVKRLADDVDVVRLSEGGMQPQVAVDSKGVAHVIYLKGDPSAADIFYARLENGRFSVPVRVNSVEGSAVATGTVRGAQLALGRNGRAHVVWFGSKKGALGNPVMYARMNDAGTAFEPERNLMHQHGGLDGGPTLTADQNGSVWVAWHGIGAAPGEVNRQVWLAKSRDDGRTFMPEASAISEKTGACACCSMRAYADRSGDLYLFYRTATENVHRDMYLAVSKDGGKFQGKRVHPWNINACPMTTTMFAENANRLVAAWETEKQVYFAGVKPESAPIAPAGSAGRKHPAIAMNAAGETLLVWDEGTAFRTGGSVAWQRFDGRNQPVGEIGRAPGEPAFSLPAVYARADGAFTVVY